MIRPIYITDQDFNSICFKHHGFALVECVSSFSGSKQIMEPVLNKINNSFNQELNLYRIHTDKYPLIVKNFCILQEPTFLLFYNGEFIDRIVGFMPFKELMQKIKKNMEHTS